MAEIYQFEEQKDQTAAVLPLELIDSAVVSGSYLHTHSADISPLSLFYTPSFIKDASLRDTRLLAEKS